VLTEKGFSTVALHGDLTQNNRNKIMDSFSRGKEQVLVTTDIASRGLDLLNVSHVINFDIPKHTEEYIHRIGRTGRAGDKGDAISIIGPKDWVNFKKVEEFVQQHISFSRVEGIKPKFKGIKEVVAKAAQSRTADSTNKKKVVNKAAKVKKAPNKIFHEAKEVGFAPMRRKKKVQE